MKLCNGRHSLPSIFSWILLLFLIQSSRPIYGQNQHFMPFGLSFGFETVKDEALSPVSYSGPLGGVLIGYQFESEKWLTHLHLNGLGGYQHPDVNRENNKSETLSGLVRANLMGARRIFVLKDWHVYGGLNSINLVDYRQHNRYGNSSENFVGHLSLGPILTTQRNFELFQKQWLFHFQFSFPVGTYYFRPGYVKPLSNQEIGNKDFAFWGDFYLLETKTELRWILKNENQLRLTYHWEFSQLDKLNKVQTNLQQVSLSTVFKF